MSADDPTLYIFCTTPVYIYSYIFPVPALFTPAETPLQPAYNIRPMLHTLRSVLYPIFYVQACIFTFLVDIFSNPI